MRQPDINDLLQKVDSRYTLVVTAARRARQLIDGDPPRVEAGSHKPISVALREIVADEVSWSRADSAASESAGETGASEAEVDPQPTVDAPDGETADGGPAEGDGEAGNEVEAEGDADDS